MTGSVTSAWCGVGTSTSTMSGAVACTAATPVAERRVGEVAAPPCEPVRIVVARGDDLDVVAREIRGQHELGDLSETDDADADGSCGRDRELLDRVVVGFAETARHARQQLARVRPALRRARHRTRCWPSTTSSIGVSAVTSCCVAPCRAAPARRTPRPGPSVATLRPRRLTLAVPLRITKNSAPVAPSLTRILPASTCTSSARRATSASSLRGEGGEEGDLGKVPQEGVVTWHGGW